MANETNAVAGSGLSGLNPLLRGQTATKNKNAELGKNEFLTLLITQLKNQDPQDPADSKEFATQLAQFTQVEKLISIDQNISNQTNAIGSMAGYLGQQVVLNAKDIVVKDRQGGQLQVNLSQDAASLKVDFLSKSGEVVGSKDFGALRAGKGTLSLDGLTIPDGAYGIKVSAVSSRGTGSFNPDVSVAGIVSGFIPGPTPKLIVGGREVSVSDIKEVTLPPK